MSSSSWQFSCTDGAGQDLCYNNGVCGTNTTSFCVCPEGYTHDFDWFHFNNCAKGVDSTKDFVIFYGIMLSLLGLLYIFRIHRKLRTTAKFLGILSFLTLYGEMGLMVSIYVQGGCYEACAVTSVIHFCVCVLIVQQIILISLMPIYSLQHQSVERLRRTLLIWCVVICLCFLATAIAMLVTMRADDLMNEYNYAAFASTGVLWIYGFISAIWVIWASSKLHSKLSDMGKFHVEESIDGQRYTYDGLKTRLRLLQFGAIGISIPYIALLVAVPVVIYVYGSFPYFYVVFYLEMSTGAFFFTGTAFQFVNPTNKASSASVKRSRSAPKQVESRLDSFKPTPPEIEFVVPAVITEAVRDNTLF